MVAPVQWPVLSADGKTVAYANVINGRISVHRVSADGAGSQEIDSYVPLCFCDGKVDSSADGKNVVSTDAVQIRHTGAGGSNQVLVLDSNEIWDVRIAGNASRIFFLLRRDATIRNTSTRLERGVYAMNLDGSALQQLTGPTAMAAGLGVTADKISPFAGCGRTLDVSSDGGQVAFVAMVDGMERVFSMPGAGGAPRKLVDASGGFKLVGKIGLSGDGRLVGYQAIVADGMYELGVIGADGSGRRRLALEPPAPLGGCQGNLRLTQDGRKLYVSDPSYLYDTDGSGVSQISIGVWRPPGGAPVKDGHPGGWMNANASRFVHKNADDKNIAQLMLVEVNPADLGAAPALADPTFTPAMVTVPGLDTARATVRATGTAGLRVGVAFTLDGLPDTIDRGGGILFGDKGMAGDATANDGIWSGLGFHGFNVPKPGPRSIRFTAEAATGGRRHATVLEASGMVVLP
jgi:hypothetical protein